MIISVKNGVTRMPEWRMAEPVDFELDNNEHIAIVGPNASGKSMLVDIITGSHPLLMQDVTYDFAPNTSKLVSENIKYITFRDTYGGDNDRTYYLQQRWNQMEIDENTPTVGKVLEEAYMRAGEDSGERRAFKEHLYEIFNLKFLLDKYIILLSSGELRKLQLCRVLMTAPRVLIMDNPFIGLDKETRQQLRELLETISSERCLQIILVLAKDEDIPKFITHVVPVRDRVVLPKVTREQYMQTATLSATSSLTEEQRREILDIPYREDEYNTDEVVRMNKVSIRYGARTILQELDWTVHNGERWALSGQNGAGKSTLLSLVCADNPQSYACDIVLFDQQRGHGESIWDIKKHIGYVSPEMHRAYNRDMPAIRIVASGLKDSVGLYVKPSAGDYEICRKWMRIFGIEDLADRTFLKLSSGEQRMVLLARAFVKDPELLILDEPLHGLDAERGELVKDIIDTFCQRKNKTLIMVTHYKENLPPCITNSIYLRRHQ
ncbi:MAG: ATP-binding cassette domain-containing protein [Prevotellaceae bacterium]|nr:ATP-binding cassette domain-containing protein [Prevotellaceae bacterium]MDO4931395.1 ATP-binding cassette domain-containing protein [Prevotellaceae bacterium]